jgi:hypothetical protein
VSGGYISRVTSVEKTLAVKHNSAILNFDRRKRDVLQVRQLRALHP